MTRTGPQTDARVSRGLSTLLREQMAQTKTALLTETDRSFLEPRPRDRLFARESPARTSKRCFRMISQALCYRTHVLQKHYERRRIASAENTVKFVSLFRDATQKLGCKIVVKDSAVLWRETLRSPASNPYARNRRSRGSLREIFRRCTREILARDPFGPRVLEIHSNAPTVEQWLAAVYFFSGSYKMIVSMLVARPGAVSRFITRPRPLRIIKDATTKKKKVKKNTKKLADV